MLLVWRYRQKCLDQSNHTEQPDRACGQTEQGRNAEAGGRGWGWLEGGSMSCFCLGYELWAPLCWCICRSAGITWWHKSLKCSKKLLRNQHNFHIIITWFSYLLTEYELICIRETCIGVEKFICAVPFIWGYYCWIQSFICSFHMYCTPAMCKALC